MYIFYNVEGSPYLQFIAINNKLVIHLKNIAFFSLFMEMEMICDFNLLRKADW